MSSVAHKLEATTTMVARYVIVLVSEQGASAQDMTEKRLPPFRFPKKRLPPPPPPRRQSVRAAGKKKSGRVDNRQTPLFSLGPKCPLPLAVPLLLLVPEKGRRARLAREPLDRPGAKLVAQGAADLIVLVHLLLKGI